MELQPFSDGNVAGKSLKKKTSVDRVIRGVAILVEGPENNKRKSVDRAIHRAGQAKVYYSPTASSH